MAIRHALKVRKRNKNRQKIKNKMEEETLIDNWPKRYEGTRAHYSGYSSQSEATNNSSRNEYYPQTDNYYPTSFSDWDSSSSSDSGDYSSDSSSSDYGGGDFGGGGSGGDY